MTPSPNQVDKVIHEPARLLLTTHLFAVVEADFVYLRRATGLTAGNLSTHLSKLEGAGYIKITKAFEGKRPKTTVQLTPKGRKAFEDYRKNILQVLGS